MISLTAGTETKKINSRNEPVYQAQILNSVSFVKKQDILWGSIISKMDLITTLQTK